MTSAPWQLIKINMTFLFSRFQRFSIPMKTLAIRGWGCFLNSPRIPGTEKKNVAIYPQNVKGDDECLVDKITIDCISTSKENTHIP